MGPDHFRKGWGFAAVCAAPATLLSAAPALAAGFNASVVLGAAPLAIALGAGAFALIALSVLRSLKREGRQAMREAGDQISSLRALVDEYEALLAGPREVTIFWTEHGAEPKFLGQTSAVLPVGQRPDALLDYPSWLGEADAQALQRALTVLRTDGRAFDLSLTARDGRVMRASGWVMGGGIALRIRPAHSQPSAVPAMELEAGLDDAGSARAILSVLTMPAFLRDDDGALRYANPAYQQLARSMGKACSETDPVELVGPEQLTRHLANIAKSGKPHAFPLPLGEAGSYDLVEFPVGSGTAGYLRLRSDAAASPGVEPGLAQFGAVIDALSAPIAVFNAQRELVQFNRAFLTVWDFDAATIRPGMDERQILDRLRNEGKLPAEADYHGWRTRHLTSYTLKSPRREPWHLPDGRTIDVLSAPAGPKGGVIYVFDDISERLKLESLNKAMGNVQRESLNALSEAVAVFGTNGKLTLSNPRLSFLWKLPINELGQSPHIDQIAAACAKSMPEDGAVIWRELKRSIIDLNPTRSDTTGRITRADGRLLDYAVTRLPDGQTMMTFLDVTESANYSRLLKERNDALVTADKLKDAFVQNVSYELRSPLTNIIGFADLLASGEVGPLNERQRSYTDYIRASSVTLGVLIDNILDLATVDAGIAELRPELQDVHALVEKARAGLAATFPEINGEKPINLVIDIPETLPPFLADGTRLVQVLYNLLSNAARFSDPGARITLSVVPRGDRMLFVVEDEGAGMTEEVKAAILDNGDQPAVAGRQRGAGLGLAIVKTFVNLHGGTITVERREPRGTRVTVNLPRDAAFAGAAE